MEWIEGWPTFDLLEKFMFLMLLAMFFIALWVLNVFDKVRATAGCGTLRTSVCRDVMLQHYSANSLSTISFVQNWPQAMARILLPFLDMLSCESSTNPADAYALFANGS